MNQELTQTVRVIDSREGCPELAIVVGDGRARALIRPENGAHWRTFNLIELAAGASTVDLRHASDCVYYVDRGRGAVRDLSDDSLIPLTEGAMLHIDKGDGYRFETDDAELTLIGGPCPADPALYEYLATKG
jgi:hypothetical protein